MATESQERLQLPTEDFFGSESSSTRPRAPTPAGDSSRSQPDSPEHKAGAEVEPASKRQRVEVVAATPESSRHTPDPTPLKVSPDASRLGGKLQCKTPGDIQEGPQCECGGRMCIRERKQDGAQFWGCLRFPVCQKTRALDVACDVCGKPMTRRNNKKNAGAFFGCSTYPACKRILGLEEVAPFCEFCGVAMVRRCKKDNSAEEFWGCQRFPVCRRTRPLGLSPPGNGDGAGRQERSLRGA